MWDIPEFDDNYFRQREAPEKLVHDLEEVEDLNDIDRVLDDYLFLKELAEGRIGQENISQNLPRKQYFDLFKSTYNEIRL